MIQSISRVIVVLLVLSGCRPRPTPTPPPPSGGVCPTPSTATTDGVCDNWFTVSGLACVVCPNRQGCIDTEAQVYCTKGPCQADLACNYEIDATK